MRLSSERPRPRAHQSATFACDLSPYSASGVMRCLGAVATCSIVPGAAPLRLKRTKAGGFAPLLHTWAQLVRAKVRLRRPAAAWLAEFCAALTVENVGMGASRHKLPFHASSNPIIQLMQAPSTLICDRSSYSWYIKLCSRIGHPIGVQLPKITAPSLKYCSIICPCCSIISPRLLRFAQVVALFMNAP
jgi:uncharacterized membrane protein